MIVNRHLKLYEAMTIASKMPFAYIVQESEYDYKSVLKLSPEKELLNTSLHYALTDCYWKLMHPNGWNADQFQSVVCKDSYYICTDIEDLFEDWIRANADCWSKDLTQYCNKRRIACAVRKRVISKATAERLLELCDKLQKEKEADDN